MLEKKNHAEYIYTEIHYTILFAFVFVWNFPHNKKIKNTVDLHYSRIVYLQIHLLANMYL